jgi:hypothetical protein
MNKISEYKLLGSDEVPADLKAEAGFRGAARYESRQQLLDLDFHIRLGGNVIFVRPVDLTEGTTDCIVAFDADEYQLEESDHGEA